MNWKVSNTMDKRIKFVARMLEGEKMAGLCREFGISRKTGYKIWERYKECGLEGLQETGGESGIRTHGTLTRTTVFETLPALHPQQRLTNYSSKINRLGVFCRY